MANIVLVKSLQDIAKIKDYYKSYLLDKTPPGGLFAAKTPDCSITAYKSGKVMFQGKAGEVEAGKWGGSASSSSATPSKKEKSSSHLPPGIESLSIIGSDEVGTGDFFGPITVVAAYVKKEQIPLLQELGVKDSKGLKDEKIIEIAKSIKDVVPHSLLVLHNEKYNQLQRSGMSQGKIKGILHNQAIGHVLKKIAPEKPEAILIDQFAQKEVYFNYLKGQSSIVKENVYFSTKAEGIHLAVAAASILARYAFVRHFEKLSEAAGMTLPKGAGFQVDEAAAKLILKLGESELPRFVKLHFANTEKAQKLVRKKRGL